MEKGNFKKQFRIPRLSSSRGSEAGLASVSQVHPSTQAELSPRNTPPRVYSKAQTCQARTHGHTSLRETPGRAGPTWQLYLTASRKGRESLCPAIACRGQLSSEGHSSSASHPVRMHRGFLLREHLTHSSFQMCVHLPRWLRNPWNMC